MHEKCSRRVGEIIVPGNIMWAVIALQALFVKLLHPFGIVQPLGRINDVENKLATTERLLARAKCTSTKP